MSYCNLSSHHAVCGLQRNSGPWNHLFTFLLCFISNPQEQSSVGFSFVGIYCHCKTSVTFNLVNTVCKKGFKFLLCILNLPQNHSTVCPKYFIIVLPCQVLPSIEQQSSLPKLQLLIPILARTWILRVLLLTLPSQYCKIFHHFPSHFWCMQQHHNQSHLHLKNSVNYCAWSSSNPFF